jgi:DNA-binding NtrC family response regulator
MDDDQRTITVDDLSGAGAALEAPCLLLHHREGVELVRLPAGAAVVVGRSEPADVVLNDPSLSRPHARFEARERQIWVQDLESKNGTWVNGERTSLHRIAAGDTIRLGGVAVTLHAGGVAVAPAEGLVSNEALMLSLERELVRARIHRKPLALVRIRGARGAEELQARLPEVIQAGQPARVAALYGPGELHLLWTGATPKDALTRAEELARRLAEQGCEVRCGVAVFPDVGGSPDALVAGCGRALRRSSKEHLARSAPARRAVGSDAGERPVVLSPAMRALFETVERLALATIPVLLQGETGTGKEIVARAIHDAGPRREGPLRAVNCGGLPEQLVESALFGHERGAFTGADRQHQGIFEQAQGGTVLLDEIGELSPGTQAALLRVLETGRVLRVGGTEEVELDVRVIAATNRDLEAMVSEGGFRQDLLFRLNAVTLEVPPLRERPEEIPALVERFLQEAQGRQPSTVAGVSPEALELLRRYRWPGNVRELRNVIERAVVIARGDRITPDDLSPRVCAASSPDRGSADEVVDFRTRIQRHEAELILEALRESGWNQSEAARRLNMPLRTMVRKIQAYGLHK